MALKMLPPREYVRECLDYDQETGEFRWRKRPPQHFDSPHEYARWNSRYAGTIAGSDRTDGYVAIYINRSRFLAHRLAWLLVYGEPVPLMIDHIDGHEWNNRSPNLRVADYPGNLANQRVHRNSTTGVKGVFLVKLTGRFVARVTKNRRPHHIGTFDTIEEAATARREAAERLHGEFARD
jgi:hypothetical protein